MIGTDPRHDRAWRFGAYAFATLVHLPLIVAVQQFGDAIAAARPVESVITLLDTPETERVTAVDVLDGRADPVQRSAGTLTAQPLSATTLETTATATSIEPAGTIETAAVPNVDVQSIEGLIASDTLSPSAVAPAAASPAGETVTAMAVDEPSQAPAPAETVTQVAATAVTPPVVSEPVPPASAPALQIAAASVRSPPAVASPVASSAASRVSQAAATIAAAGSSATAAPVDVAIGSLKTTPASAAPLPRIAIVATGPTPAARAQAVGAVPDVAVAARPVPSAAVAPPAARVVSSVEGTSIASGAGGVVGAPSVTRPVVDTNPATLRDTSIPTARDTAGPAGRDTAGPTGIVEPESRIAAIPADAARGRADRAALNEFVRGYQGGGCFAALTVATTDDDIAVSGFSRDETALAGFENALGQRAGPRPSAAARTVSEAQCSVLAFARAQGSYPDFPIRLALDPDRIPSGGTIKGRISGAGDRPVTMLILDDEGRIQDATFLLSRGQDGAWTFQTPLSLTGSPVPTVQLFVALAGDGPIAAMRPPVPVEARRYFAEIDRVLKSRRQTLDVALAAFTVDRATVATTP